MEQKILRWYINGGQILSKSFQPLFTKFILCILYTRAYVTYVREACCAAMIIVKDFGARGKEFYQIRPIWHREAETKYSQNQSPGPDIIPYVTELANKKTFFYTPQQ